jgi:hypothetical protein
LRLWDFQAGNNAKTPSSKSQVALVARKTEDGDTVWENILLSRKQSSLRGGLLYMPNWECPTCHVANRPEDAECCACRHLRPSSWEQGKWRCPHCGRQNSNRDKYCSKCGQFAEAGTGEGENLNEGVNGLRDALKEQRRSILNDIQSDLSKSLHETKSSILGLNGSMPDLSDIKVGMPDLKDIGASFPTSRPRASTPDLETISRRTPAAFERVTTRNLEVEIRALPRLSYALNHAGLPLIHSLAVKNSSSEPAHDLLIKAWVAPDYGEPWQKSVPAIPAGEIHTESDVVIPLSRNRLQEVREAEKAGLRVDISTEGSLQYSETLPIEVLAYNDWYYHPAIAQTIACFVQPNSEAVERIVSLIQARLRSESRDDSLSGYQSGNPQKVIEMVEALYKVMQKDLRLGYINPPASFEEGERLPDGSFTMWQKVFFPEQILEHRRGTCLDLAILCASCVERIGLHPLLFLIRGHAFFGVWTREKILNAPVLRDPQAVISLVSEGDWLPLNSTTFTASVPKGFDECLKEGKYYLLERPDDFHCAIDVKSARSIQPPIKPLPPLPA